MAGDYLSPFLRKVLAAFQEHLRGISVEPQMGEPDPESVVRLADLLEEDPEDVRMALIGLRAGNWLMEEEISFAGIEEMFRWSVHPQCRV